MKRQRLTRGPHDDRLSLGVRRRYMPHDITDDLREGTNASGLLASWVTSTGGPILACTTPMALKLLARGSLTSATALGILARGK